MDIARRALMIAYHFPPLRGSSGVQRTLRFCRYLPEFGWTPVVLTASERAYEEIDESSRAEIPAGLVVRRAFALNTARHLSVGGRYPALLAVPDRWVSWLAGGVLSGLAMIRRMRPDVIFSTYPIATAHVIGLALHRLTGLPWVADFRDPMAQRGYPADPRIWRSFKWIEERTFRHARRALFTSPSAMRDYRRIYPDIATERFVLIENGYDEEAFERVEPSVDPQRVDNHRGKRRLVILHSGIVYPSERDPTQFFVALGALKRAGALSAADVEFRFRASANDAMLRTLAGEHAVEDLVSIVPHIPYAEALREMMSADGLMLMQAANCNAQIPAKAYEYLRAGRPLLALTDAEGDTADLVRRAGIPHITPLDSVAGLMASIPTFIGAIRNGDARSSDLAFAAACSRRERTRLLAATFDATMM